MPDFETELDTPEGYNLRRTMSSSRLGAYNLPHTVAYVLAGEARASEERMLELLEPYRGRHRFRVIRLLWMNGVSAPRRGPRHHAG